jgi:alkylated DNA nucleotide flippase Atl1
MRCWWRVIGEREKGRKREKERKREEKRRKREGKEKKGKIANVII